MPTNYEKPRSTNLAPLVLRLAVASVFAMAGAGQLALHHQPITTDAPPIAEAASEVANLTQDAKVPTSGILPKMAEVGDEGVEVKLGWADVVGVGELGFAAVLLLGLLTRLAALAGLGTVTFAALANHEVVASGRWLDQLTGMYESNPFAMLLVGAICLSLLVSGSGPLSLDRTFFGRKKAQSATDSVASA